MHDCIEWNGAKSKTGYGVKKFRGRVEKMHRVAWIQQRGEIPEGAYVLHKCDNRVCYNIDHLYIGNHSDNMRDARDRERLRNQVLNWGTVRTIRYLYESGVSQGELAWGFGLSPSRIDHIVNERQWRER